MNKRQYLTALTVYLVMVVILAVTMLFYRDNPPPTPKPPCICREGLRPVTYDTPHGQQRVCLTSNSYALQKAEGCEFTGERDNG